MKEFDLKLSESELNIILEGLLSMPASRSMGLIVKLREQAINQVGKSQLPLQPEEQGD